MEAVRVVEAVKWRGGGKDISEGGGGIEIPTCTCTKQQSFSNLDPGFHTEGEIKLYDVVVYFPPKRTLLLMHTLRKVWGGRTLCKNFPLQ